MTFLRRLALPAILLGSVALTPLLARDPMTPEQRIRVLERQVRQMQNTVFPKGQPASTAYDDAPAATQASVQALSQRLDSIEGQMSQLVRATEENGNRVGLLEAEIARLRADQDRRLRAIETAPPAGEDPAATDDSAPAPRGDSVRGGPPPAPKPKYENGDAPKVADAAPAASMTFSDPAEAAYDAGYRLWNAGKYDQAVTALQKMAKDYPSHRRASWAYNLAGRAMLDKGQYRAAAEALLANYRRDPKGERAQDSLYYLGQSLVKLGQPAQACKAYGELESVYGSGVRASLKADLSAAKSAAKCG